MQLDQASARVDVAVVAPRHEQSIGLGPHVLSPSSFRSFEPTGSGKEFLVTSDADPLGEYESKKKWITGSVDGYFSLVIVDRARSGLRRGTLAAATCAAAALLAPTGAAAEGIAPVLPQASALPDAAAVTTDAAALTDAVLELAGSTLPAAVPPEATLSDAPSPAAAPPAAEAPTESQRLISRLMRLILPLPPWRPTRSRSFPKVRRRRERHRERRPPRRSPQM